MKDISRELNILEFSSMYRNMPGVVYLDPECIISIIHELKGTREDSGLNLYGCNVGRYWDRCFFWDDKTMKRVLSEIVDTFPAFKDITACFERMDHGSEINKEDEDGLLYFQKYLLKYADKELLEKMITQNYLKDDEIGSAAAELGSNGRTDLFMYLLERKC